MADAYVFRRASLTLRSAPPLTGRSILPYSLEASILWASWKASKTFMRGLRRSRSIRPQMFGGKGSKGLKAIVNGKRPGF